jgi:hypothetical protein
MLLLSLLLLFAAYGCSRRLPELLLMMVWLLPWVPC